MPSLVKVDMRLSKEFSQKFGMFDKIWVTYVTLKILGPNKDIFVHSTFDHDESTLQLKISKILLVESYTSMHLECAKK